MKKIFAIFAVAACFAACSTGTSKESVEVVNDSISPVDTLTVVDTLSVDSTMIDTISLN